jgi:hypothetical protein
MMKYHVWEVFLWVNFGIMTVANQKSVAIHRIAVSHKAVASRYITAMNIRLAVEVKPIFG